MTTYSAKNVNISLGTHSVSCVGEDTFIKISKAGDGTTRSVSAWGEVVKSVSCDTTSDAELTTQFGSPTFVYLMGRWEMSQAGKDGDFPINVTGLDGSLKFHANETWVVKRPDLEYGKTAKDVTFALQTGASTLKK